MEESDDREVMALARAPTRGIACDASYPAFAIQESCAPAGLDRRVNEAAAAEDVAPFD